jgi:hypothetical protein
MMNATTEMASADESPTRGQSLRSTLKAFVKALDYDPQLHMYTSRKELVSTASRLEARLAVLEQREVNKPVPLVTEIEERE